VAGASLPRKAILVVNAHSRKGRDTFEEVCKKLTAAGINLIDSHAVENPEIMEPVVKAAIAKAPMVILGGGDGTLSSNIDHFMGTKTVFAILPLGTANSFARTLGIPLDVDGAIDVIANGRRERIDLGRIDGDYFANTAAMGLSPLIADSVPQYLKSYLGIVGYLIWAVRCAFRFRPFRFTVDDGKAKATVWATEVRIANGRHLGGVELVEAAALDSGEIIIQAVTGRHLASLARNWFMALFKIGSREATVTEFHGPKLAIDARPRQKISIDGELAARTPVTVTVARNAVTVAAPSPPD
jgi:YegS/Rv2252/BmrU family lipid kinase